MEIVELLVRNYHAKVRTKDSFGNTPLHHVMENHRNNNGEYIEIAHILVQAGANVNARNNVMRTPLHRAARKGNLQAVEFLIRHGASVNAQDKYGQTPLCIAQTFGYQDIINLLMTNGAYEGACECHACKKGRKKNCVEESCFKQCCNDESCIIL